MIELCLKPIGQPLPVILFTLFLNLLPISDGGYLLANDANVSGDKSENSKSKHHDPPALSFKAVQSDPVYPTIIWDKTFGGSSDESPSSVIPTPDGGYLIAGSSHSNSSGDKSENSKGDYDYWIVKTDDQGTKVWDKTFGGIGRDWLGSAILTPDGGYLLGGFSSLNTSGSSAGPFDYWIVKTDAEGNKVWDKTIDVNISSIVFNTILAVDGGYLLASTFGSDYWIVKIDADGNKVWDKTLGGNSGEELSAAFPTPDGNYLLVGISGSDVSGDKSVPRISQTNPDYWVVKIDGLGNKIWDKAIGGNSRPYSAIPTQDGGYLIAGDSNSDAFGDKSEDSKGKYDYWIVKIDADGNKIWDKTVGGEENDFRPNAIPTPDGGYLLAGTSYSDASGDKSEDNKDYYVDNDIFLGDYWVVKIDANGHKVWDKTIGGTDSDRPGSLILTSDDSYLLAGSSDSRALKDKSENSKGSSDYWIVKIKEQNPPAISSLTLMNANRNFGIRELRMGNVIPQEEGLQSIRANTFPEEIDRVAFELTGPINHSQVEKTPPYALFGDTEGDYAGMQLPIGKYTLTVTPYTQTKKGTVLTVSFEIVKNDNPEQATIEWDKTFGGKKSDWISEVIPTTDGGYLLAGYSSSDASGDKSENSRGDDDYWVIKIDADRNKVWDKIFGGNKSDRLNDVIPTTDGGYLLVGSSESNASGDKSENSRGEGDYWVVKIDTDGNIVWDKTFGGSKREGLGSAISTPDGGYLLAGSSSSDASGDKSENSKGGDDYWIVKIDANGTKLWDKTIGGSSADYLQSIISTSDGNYLLAGVTDSTDPDDEYDDYDYWIIKIDTDGNKLWDKTLGGNREEQLNNVILTPDGGYLLSGSTTSDAVGDVSGGNTSESDFGSDYWIIKIDANGNKVWDKTFGGRYNEGGRALLTPDGGYLLAGFSNSGLDGFDRDYNNGDVRTYDFWIIRTDANGNKIWDNMIGGEGNEGIRSAILTPDGSYLLAGYSDSNASGDKSENSRGAEDYWIVKLKDNTAPAPVVTTLTLIDAKTDQDIQSLKQGDVVPLNSGLLNIRANTLGPIDRVTLKLQGPVNHNRTESEAPYALFGDNQGNYGGKVLKTGMYTITATPYSEDKKGNALTVSFEVTNASVISGFTLINATRDQVVGILSQGAIIDLASFGNHQLTIRAETKAMNLEKITFVLQGPINQSISEGVAPYALFGDQPAPDGSPNYKGVKWKPGAYILTATPYPDGSMDTPSTISFSVIDSRGLSPEAASLHTEIYPVPTSGIINILHDGQGEGAQLLLMDFDGNQLLNKPMGAQPVEQVDMSGFKKGIYYLKVITPEAVQIFRVVKE